MRLIYRFLWDSNLHAANTIFRKFSQTKLQDKSVIDGDEERETEKVRDVSDSEAIQFRN